MQNGSIEHHYSFCLNNGIFQPQVESEMMMLDQCAFLQKHDYSIKKTSNSCRK